MRHLLVSLIGAVACGGAEASWSVSGPVREQAIFAARPAQVTAVVASGLEGVLSAEVTLEVWQAGGAIAVPISRETAPRTIRLEAGRTNRIMLDWTSPEIRGRSRFVLRFIDGRGRLAGAVPVTAHPTNLFTEFAGLLESLPVELVDPPNSVALWFADFSSARRAGNGLRAVTDRAVLRWFPETSSSNGEAPGFRKVELTTGKSSKSHPPAGSGPAPIVIEPDLFLRLDQDPDAVLHLMDLLKRAAHTGGNPKPPKEAPTTATHEP